MQLLRRKRFWGFLLLPLALGLTALAEAYPHLTEAVYSRKIYPVFVGLLGRMTSLLPFSIAQWLIILLPPALIAYLIVRIRKIVLDRERRRDRLVRLTATILCLVGVGYFLFVVFCGLNYHRESFTVYSGLEVRPSPTAELAALCEELVESANALRGLVAQDGDALMTSSFAGYYATASFAREAYTEIGNEFAALGGYTVRPKPVTFSRAMSYLDITGVYVPYTFEANVNVDIPDFWIPSTMMHELAHSKGFMREDEANFISYLACTKSGHPDFQYSGTLLALVHSTNALYAADRELFWPIGEMYSDGVRRDLNATTAYWKQFEGPVAEVSSAVNDAYLKSNRQSGGVKSYGRMVDLLLADYRQRHALS